MKNSLTKGLIFIAIYISVNFFLYYFRAEDYFDEHLQFPEIVKELKYPFEIHELYNRQGYYLNIFRIQKKNQSQIQPNLPTIVLMHGLNADANIWIANFEEKAVPFTLANKGYDVWITNDRGNFFTRKHKYLDPDKDKEQFWSYSWQDTAIEDLPLVFEYIGNKVKQNFSVISHSQGAAQLLISLSNNESKSQVQKWLDKVIFFGPSVIAQEHRSLALKVITILQVPNIMAFMGNYEYSDPYKLSYYLDKYFSFLLPYVMHLISDSVNSPLQNRRFHLFLRKFPSGTSVYYYQHWTQLTQVEQFQKLDYGREENLKRYNQETPTNFDLSQIQGTFHFFYGENDQVATYPDLMKLVKLMKNANIKIYNTTNGHLSFLLSKDMIHMEIVNQILEN